MTPIADVRGCQDTMVYIADCQTYSLIVYNPNENKSWRITDKTMYPYPNLGTYHILGKYSLFTNLKVKFIISLQNIALK